MNFQPTVGDVRRNEIRIETKAPIANEHVKTARLFLSEKNSEDLRDILSSFLSQNSIQVTISARKLEKLGEAIVETFIKRKLENLEII